MSTIPRFDDAWKHWLDDNLRRGCTHQSLIDAMVAATFHPNAARLILARHIAGDAVDPHEDASAEYVYGTPILPSGRVLASAITMRQSSSVANNPSSHSSPMY